MSDRGEAGFRGAAMRRRVTLPVVVCTLLCALVARPAFAAPPDPNVPNPGSRPVADATLPLPGAPTTPGSAPRQPAVPVSDPLAAQVNAENAAVELLGEQRLQVQANLDQAKQVTATTESAWRQAADALAELRRKADSAASDAYKAAVALGPLEQYADDLHQLSQLAPGLGEMPGGEELAREVAEAEQLERTTHAAYTNASAAQEALFTRSQSLKQQYDQRSAVLQDLLARNTAALARIEAEQEARDQELGSHLDVGTAVDGMTANPKAIAALQFALAQRGKWYEWGAEGPLHFDCSGLMFAAYGSVGFHNLPRVSSDQYHALKPVAINKLLPGDLLFFGEDRGDWHSIHHVGMYLGNNRMIHSPRTGDVVKISSIQWSWFFGAARVFDAVPAPKPAPQPAPPPTTTPPTTTPPTTTPPSTTPPSQSPSPTPAPTQTEPPPATTPSPTPSASSSSPPAPEPTSQTPTPAATSTP